MSQNLSELQLALLKTFSREVSEEDVCEIKRLITRYFAEKAIREADKVWDEEGWNDNKVDDLLNAHLRTPYTKKSGKV